MVVVVVVVGGLEMPFNREGVEKCHQRKCHE